MVEPLPSFLFVDVKQEVCTEDPLVTGLLLDSVTADQDQCPGYKESHKHTSESSSDYTEGHKQFEQIHHIPTQTGENPFNCKQCGSGFPKSCNLKQHMQTHTGDKPFICNECGAGFSKNCNRKQHMLTHSGEKPFICNQCGSGFTKASDVKKHMRTHTGEEP